MKRREALLAREENRPTKTLLESDFLLGINDETRMGGLRFKKSSEGPFLASLPDLEIPPITSIRTLEEASLQVESDDFFNQSDANRWLNVLIAPGSSLGGARPKANVKDTDGHLWIAKFPSKNDEWNIGAWEHLANTLAARLNITVTETNARRFSQKQHTFLSKRFDRNAAGERIHFASAMTLLNRKDGYGATDGGSYLELVELIERFGVKAEEDIRELWKRIVFSVLISNTDDHLRNHGFILTENGWRLSPVYDINPNPSGQGLSLNISDDDNSLSLELCKEVASYYRWKDCEARKFIADALKVVQGWSRSAKEFGISSAEQNLMALAFENKF
ncbi:MAG: HipA domain-containing protein [Bacteroidota bacterium]